MNAQYGVYSIPQVNWSYAAAAAGILNTTTAVTIKSAAGAGVRNYLTSLSVVAEILGVATEIAIRDGAGGTVVWRIKVGTAGLLGGLYVPLLTPIGGSPNTLLEVVTLSASVTGAVYINASGFTGA